MSPGNPPPPENRPLDYATPERPPRGAFVAQMGIGFAAFIAWGVVTALALFGVANLLGPANRAAIITIFALTTTGLTILTVVAYRRWHWRGFLPGVLVGVLTAIVLTVLIVVGLVLLLIAICGGWHR